MYNKNIKKILNVLILLDVIMLINEKGWNYMEILHNTHEWYKIKICMQMENGI